MCEDNVRSDYHRFKLFAQITMRSLRDYANHFDDEVRSHIMNAISSIENALKAIKEVSERKGCGSGALK